MKQKTSCLPGKNFCKKIKSPENYFFKKHSELSSLKLLNFFSPASCLMPSLDELTNIVHFKKKTPQIFQISLDDKIHALAIFIIENRKIHGINLTTLSLVGHDYFDYNFFFCESNVLRDFLRFIKIDAKKNNIDAVILENIINDKDNHFFLRKENIFYFDSTIQAYNGFQFIFKKKSISRHINLAQRQLKYSCFHGVGEFENNDIETLAKIHRERWNFDGIKSAFLDKNRVGLYTSHKNNKILTVLRNDNDIIAMHYGMILGDRLLWHTPAINIKYLKFSPIELLLFEISTWCQKNNLLILDYGLGDEKYKKRFSNQCHEVGFKIISSSFKSYLLYFLLILFDIQKMKFFFLKYTLFSKKILRKIIFSKNRINYYEFTKNGCLPNLSAEFNFVIIDTFSNLVDIFRENEMQIKNLHYDRIKSGDIMFCLMKGSCLLSFGWGTRSPYFFVSEINKTICNKEKLLLYDFYTPASLRRNGYYSLLLAKICANYGCESITIFSDKRNSASNKAILNAGFKKSEFNVT